MPAFFALPPLLVGFLAVPVVSPSVARDAPNWKPVPPAGMLIEYKFSKGSDTRHTITKADGDDVWNTVRLTVDGKLRANNNITFRSILTGQLPREGAGILRWKFDRRKPASLWPLKVGNSVRIRAELSIGHGRCSKKRRRISGLRTRSTIAFA